MPLIRVKEKPDIQNAGAEEERVDWPPGQLRLGVGSQGSAINLCFLCLVSLIFTWCQLRSALQVFPGLWELDLEGNQKLHSYAMILN